MHIQPCEGNINRCETGKYHFQVGTNDLNSEKTSSQIARSIIDPAILLKTNTNNIMSLIAPRNCDLNNKASKVNNYLANVCSERKKYAK